MATKLSLALNRDDATKQLEAAAGELAAKYGIENPLAGVEFGNITTDPKSVTVYQTQVVNALTSLVTLFGDCLERVTPLG